MDKAAVNIVGVGSTVMRDDGLGPAAIDRLRERGVPERVRLHDAGLALSDVLTTLDPAAPLILIDAVRAGGPAGSLYKLRLDPLASDADVGCHGCAVRSRADVGTSTAADSAAVAPARGGMLSLHELSVVPALRLEALAGRTFADVTVFGVEPADVAWGDTLSPAVAGAMDRLVEAILELAAAAPEPAAGGGMVTRRCVAMFTEARKSMATQRRVTMPPGQAATQACTLAGDRSL